MRRFFITGTDTDAGKTYVTCLLADYFSRQDQVVACLKPVAAGAEVVNGQLQNDDALKLQSAGGLKLAYSQINPICFAEPIAPHIAAEKHHQTVTVAGLKQRLNIEQLDADVVLIEGAGGWLVPLNRTESFADVAQAFSCQIILVVGMKLGCINHALLTIESIRNRGVALAGWVANQIDPDMAMFEQNREALIQRIEAPLLATVLYQQASGHFVGL